nr:disease resistance protein [Quercus suber]
MEVVASIVGSAVAATGRLFCGSLYSMIKSTVKLQSELDVFDKEMRSLIVLRDDVKDQTELAEKEGKVIRSNVIEWLREVDELQLKVKPIEAGMVNSRKLSGCSFNCRKRYRVSREVAEILPEIERLLKDSSFNSGVFYPSKRPRAVEHNPGPSIQAQTTASKSLEKTMSQLYVDEVRRIGIWGMGGIGKTTLVKNLNNELKSASVKSLGIVIWVTVSKNLEAKVEETLQGMATRLYQRLQKEEKFLLILDDVWEKIDLDILGVPQPEVHKGCKIILTSRFMEVCREMMTNVEVKMEVLNYEEAWQLFSQIAGDVVGLEQVRPFAEEIVRECSGLPLAIITMGTAMRGKKMIKLWKHALNELRRSVPCMGGVEVKLYMPLKWSYDSLEDGSRDGTVKMHDVVRDVAIWIASSSEEGCKSLVRSGIGLSEISVGEFSSSLRRVSFIDNKITRLPDRVIQCSEASTLLLQGNLPLDTVPESFLLGFEALRVLNISGSRIQSLPSSVLQLGDLRALLLRDYFYLEQLPSLGELNRLQVLDLCATRIRELPRGMENLNNLRQLDLSRTHYLKTIQAGIISGLSCLEVLDMTLSAYHLSVKGEVEEEQTSFEELGCLERLLVLSVRLDRIPCLNSENVTWINKLRRFQFFIGPTANCLPTRHDKRRVTISGLNLSGEWIGWLLGNASSLVLKNCLGLNEMLEDLVINSVGCFVCIKSLTIASSNSSLRPGGGCAAHSDLLPNLEELHLQDMTYQESISELVGHLGLRFQKLKLIEVTRCSQMKYLIYCGHFILTLPNLEVIKVSFCDKLDELFSYHSRQKMYPDPVAPSLRILELKNLPKLRTLCRHEQTWPCLEQVDVIKCNLLRKLPFTNQSADTMKEIKGESQ